MTARREVGHRDGREHELFMSDWVNFSGYRELSQKNMSVLFFFLFQKIVPLGFALTELPTCRTCKGSGPGPPVIWRQVH